ncbi:hypothetical protein Rsub_07778 [Raphidocelis subcapitata]|uniref:DRBM domain-containing protein n=1 Tax=Raphidocelis subcapitata TaxID=307507 RepID=A0A2V0PBU2_9CHLO|nr:hypothetical protein Rsub_07778 [Raphidocelis subcapitata]|eukprot:GBF95350.1 hypothetical protein Rsub_07778 [Raphidocelis subcapitata]
MASRARTTAAASGAAAGAAPPAAAVPPLPSALLLGRLRLGDALAPAAGGGAGGDDGAGASQGGSSPRSDYGTPPGSPRARGVDEAGGGSGSGSSSSGEGSDTEAAPPAPPALAVPNAAAGGPAAAQGQANHKGALLEAAARLRVAPPPAFQLVDTQGPPHAPTFTVRVVSGAPGGGGGAPLSAQGVGTSRKAAEHDAARAMLALPQWTAAAATAGAAGGAAGGGAAAAGGAPGGAAGGPNPKGELQELVMKGRLQALGVPSYELPAYESEARQGPAHLPVFVERVRLRRREGAAPLAAAGEGASRKAAQAEAARAMLRLLAQTGAEA